MNILAIRNQIRKRIVEISGINPETQLKLPGETFDPRNLQCWIEEFLIGGEFSVMTTSRSASKAWMIQYDFMIPAGTSLEPMEEIAEKVTSAITPGDEFRSGDATAIVSSVKTSRSFGSEFSMVAVVFSLNIYSTNMEC